MTHQTVIKEPEELTEYAVENDPTSEIALHDHDPQPNRLLIPDDHLSSTGRIEDANADLF
jgi:hypothetical protein